MRAPERRSTLPPMSIQTLIEIAVLLLVAWFVLRPRHDIDGKKARVLVGQGARLVDVRTPGEFASGHIPGAVNIPVGELPARLKDLEPKSAPVVVYCASGMRSRQAASVLKAGGFASVSNLGSIARW